MILKYVEEHPGVKKNGIIESLTDTEIVDVLWEESSAQMDLEEDDDEGQQPTKAPTSAEVMSLSMPLDPMFWRLITPYVQKK